LFGRKLKWKKEDQNMRKEVIDVNYVITAVHGYLPFITTEWSRTISQTCCSVHMMSVGLVSTVRRPRVHSVASKRTARMDKSSIPASPC